MSNRHQELASPKQTALGKDFSNPLIVDSLLKTIWFLNAPCYCNKALAIPGQTTTGKEFSNPLMAGMDFCAKHNMVAFLQKQSGSEEFHQIVDFLAGSHIRYALTANSTIYVSLVKEFWQTATVETLNEREQQIAAIVDGPHLPPPQFAITNASIRRHLQLADEKSIGGYTFGSVEGSMQLKELTDLYTKLVDRVTSLETKLKKTKEIHGKALTKLVKKGRMEETEYADIEEEYAGVEHDFEQQVTPSKAPRFTSYTTSGLFGTAEDIQDTDIELARKIEGEEQAKALKLQEQEKANFEAALKIQKQLDQERKEADDIDWQKIVEQ
ncbi:hypothetical protein Tco_0287062 [Tanacetum coccineum]